jgi:hypothetical protein
VESGESIKYKQCFTSLLYRIVREMDRLATEPDMLCVIDRKIKFVELFALALGHAVGLKIPVKVNSRGWILVNLDTLSQLLGVSSEILLKLIVLADFKYTAAYELPDDFKNVYSIAHSPGRTHWRAYRIAECVDFLLLRIPTFTFSGQPVVIKDTDRNRLNKEVARLHDMRDAIGNLSVCLLLMRQFTDEDADEEIGDYYKYLPNIIHGLALRETYIRRELFIYLGMFVQSTYKKNEYTFFIQHIQFSKVVFCERKIVRYADMCALLRVFDDYFGYNEGIPLENIPSYLKIGNQSDDESCWWMHSPSTSKTRTSYFSIEGYLPSLNYEH